MLPYLFSIDLVGLLLTLAAFFFQSIPQYGLLGHTYFLVSQ